MIPPKEASHQPLQPGQTLFFIGDHTSPDDPGYVRVVADVLARFHPGLNLRMISAGARGQNAAALNSRAMLDIVSSSRPDWLVIGIGLADAMGEPAAQERARRYAERGKEEDVVEATFGPEHRPRTFSSQPQSDAGPEPQPELARLTSFRRDLAEAVTTLRGAGVGTALMTTALVGNELDHPVNPVLHAYNKAIREAARETGAQLVDVEAAFRGIMDRAANYKQRAVLMGSDGSLNAQGQTLLARTFLEAFGLLPNPGFRRAR